MKKVCIAGATGLIGKQLVKLLADEGYYVVSLTRDLNKSRRFLPDAKEHILFGSEDFQNVISGSFAVINLSGASIAGKRWSASYKKIILESRIKTTRVLVEAISRSFDVPKVFVNASAVGIYNDEADALITEKAQLGRDFLAEVCRSWEEEAFKLRGKCRVVTARTGIVLDRKGGALAKMLLPFKLFIGGPLGSGKQWMPWIHIKDTVRLYRWVVENESIKGAVNFTAPNPVQMKEFAKVLGKVLKKPAFFRVPWFVLRLLLGESSVIVLSGQRVIPQKALENGFIFKFTKVKEALEDVFGKL